MWDENGKLTVEDVTLRTATLTRQDGHKQCEWGQDGRTEPKIVAGCGIGPQIVAGCRTEKNLSWKREIVRDTKCNRLFKILHFLCHVRQSQPPFVETSSGKDALPNTALSQTSQEWFHHKGCMKQLVVFLLPPGWDAGPSQRYPQH